METAFSNFTIKSKSRFLQTLFLLVLTLAVAIGSQPGLAQTVPPCTVSLIDTYTDNDGVPQAIDIDKDDDGLIEICDLGGLNAIRHQMDGTGYKASGSATKITAGCPATGCKGYELTRDLDFNDDDSYSSTANKITWTTATGWEPIGERSLYVKWPFVATFDGNSYTISNLMINRSSPYAMGLFGYVRDQSKIVNVGLLNVNVNLRNTGVGNNYAGGLVGYNYRASIINSYVTGSVSGTGYQVDVGGLVGFLEVGTITNSFVAGTISGGGSHTDVGGLVGQNLYGGRITNSYATGSVSGTGYRTDVGGLVGWNLSRGTITNSYAAVAISGPGFVGGLIGSGVSRGITNSYWDRQISGRATVRGGEGKTTVQLQSSTSATGIYSSWSDDAWDFGTTKQYPALKYSDGTVMPNQGRAHPDDAPQIPQVEIAGVPTGAVNEGNSVTLTASSQSTASLSYRWTQASGKALLIESITQSSVTIEVPADYVSARANTVNLAIMLAVTSDVGSTTQQVSIAIAKRNNGKIAALGPPSLNERELAAPSIDLSGDPDGSGSNIGYRWQSRESTAIAWANVPTVANTKETYTIPDGIIGGTQYRVLISYTDGQGYRGKVASQAITYERGYSLKEIASLTSCGTTDIDQDKDGLIEICNLEGLHAIRYQMDGSGYRPSSSTMKITAGCPATGCKGYELSKDLDFSDATSYRNASANKRSWTTGEGWEPIRSEASPFNAIFKANHYRISNLMINRPATREVGLFGRIEAPSRIEGVALINVNISGIWGVGSLVGTNSGGVISNSYATGTIRGGSSAGGLVGDNVGSITNSYTNVSVSGDSYVGGLVGCNFDGGTVANSYTVSRIESSDGSAGGLLGYNNAGSRIVVSSYWDGDVNGIFDGAYGVGLTTEQLQSPIVAGSTASEVYHGWSDEVWDFGTTVQYPALKYSGGTVIPNQPREQPDIPQLQVEIAGVPSGAVDEGDSVTLTASFSSNAGNIPLSYGWLQVSGGDLLIEPTTQSSVTIEVAEDYVPVGASTADLAIMLGVTSDVGSTSQHVSITIAKRNNGKIVSLGAPSLNEKELSAPTIDLSDDPDGVGSDIGYQWQSRASDQTTRTVWANVPAATDRTHTIAEDIFGTVQYRVIVSYTDGQGYNEEVISPAVLYESRYSLIEITSLTSCGTTNIDQDGDGLIEICNLDGLNAIRHQLDGSGYRPSASIMKITVGCPAIGCKGYELSTDLDFGGDDSYSSTANKITWTTGKGWQPIGTEASPFNAIFKANKHRISNLMIDRPSAKHVGLFGGISGSSRIEGVGLINVNVRGNWGIASLVGLNSGGVISSSYVTGTIRGGDSAGGLVGDNHGRIINSYTNVSVSGSRWIGGMVGCNFSGGTVTNSYTVSRIDSTGSKGGILGYNGDDNSSVVNSYWDMDVSGISSGTYGLGQTTIQLREPTMATGIYSNWSTSEWDFGTTEQYPALKYSDGTVIPDQPRERPDLSHRLSVEIAGVPVSAVDEGESITLTASSSNSASAIPLDYRWSQVSDGDLLIEPTSRSSVTIEVPEDYVSASANSINVTLILEAISDIGSTTQQVSITITKRNNGKIAALGAPSLNERELSAPSIDLSDDPDGGGSNIGYQWQSRESTATAWANVLVGANRAYTIAEDYRGSIEYRVVVGYTDGQGYSEEVISPAVAYEKIDLPISVVNPTSCDPTDIDQDNDGLIEICNLEGLSAIRYQIDGSGYKASGSATKITAGCPATGCKGYELIRNLDFDDALSYLNASTNKRRWTTGVGWQPIPSFTATFDGNDYTISNLMINRPQTESVGLFVRVGGQSKIIDIGLLNVDVVGHLYVGGLVSHNQGIITNSYVMGQVIGIGDRSYSRGTNGITGGLVGHNYGNVTNSHTVAFVKATEAGYVGGLIGMNAYGGTITSSYATGSVKATYHGNVGGLVGMSGGTITSSYATGSVATNHGNVGGLVAKNGGTITNSYATGSVTSFSSSFSTSAGGLIGMSVRATISVSYATGSVTGSGRSINVGGLVGRIYNGGKIRSSHATGSVTGSDQYADVGGLVGESSASIMNSYATGSVTGSGQHADVGGLVGENSYGDLVNGNYIDGIITNSYATGSVTGTGHSATIGGLAGKSFIGKIANSYATGSVTGTKYVGGLVGWNYSHITSSYATGSVTGSEHVGGLVGYRWTNYHTIDNSYWDKQTSGQTTSIGGEAKTTIELQSPIAPGSISTEVYYGWSTDVWDFGTTKQYPALKYRDGTVMPDQGREPSEDMPQMPQVDIAGVPMSAIGEGNSIMLTALPVSSASVIPLDYRWSQISGGGLLIEPTSRSSVTIEVPADYVSAGANTVNLAIMLEAVSDVGSTSPHVSITIAKRNNGQITALGAPILNERELSAPAIDLSSDPDGGGSDVGYQWQSRASDQTTRTVWTNVPAGTNRVHTIAEDVLGIVQYRVIVSYTDGQGYNEEVISPAVVYESRYSLIEITSLTSCGTTDIDQDNDGLIEICNLDGLNAIRYQLDGSGYRPSSSTEKITAGCPATGCKGYELSRDLDFDNDNSYSSTANKITWTTGKGWQPIGTEASPFNAIFKANKHRISNLMIDRPSARNVALFGGIGSSARIEGIALINVNVRGSWGVASLAGVSRGVISSSYATGTIRGGDSAGGLVGDNHGRITNSYTNVSVSGGDYIGGIVGCNFSGGTVTNSYTVSRLDSGSRGGILGNTNGSVANSYWDMNVSGISGGAYGLAQTTTQLQEPTTTTGIYSSWSASVWDFGTTEQYPALKYSNGTVIPNQPRERPEVPQAEIASLTSCGTTDIDQDDDGLIEICNLEGLNAIRYQLDGTGYRAGQSALLITMGCRPDGGCTGYELSRDLDFNDDNSYSSTANKNTWTMGKGWEPIGEMGSRGRFMAKFEGNDYTISNLMINRPETSRVGLFGYVNDQSKISNTGLLNINIVAGCRVGGLVGVNSGSITSSYATGSVTGVRPSNIGYSICSLAHYVGGFVSLNYGSITSSYATVSVEGSNYVGGLASFNSGSITSSYATGSVRGGWAAYVGGLVGENGSGSTITNSYATSSVTGGRHAYLGGLIGHNSQGSIANSYWDKTTSGAARSAGGLAKTTMQLQEPTMATGIYSSWSADVWDFGTTKQYPVLKYSDGTVMPDQGRVQPEGVPQIPQVEIAGVPSQFCKRR